MHPPCKPIAHVAFERLVISRGCSDDLYNAVQGPSKSLLPLLPAAQHTFPQYLGFLGLRQILLLMPRQSLPLQLLKALQFLC